jgi:hypothetical protein
MAFRRKPAPRGRKSATPPPRTRGWFHRDRTFLIAAVATAVYTALAAVRPYGLGASQFAYFNYLARAFLSGHLDLVELPALALDLSHFHGRYFLYWPPFPAVVLMPFVAVWGTHFSDVIFTLVLGGLDVVLVGILLKEADTKGLITTTAMQRNLLLITFALGSTLVPLAAHGRVWYTAQLLGFFFVAVAFLAAIRLSGLRAFLVAGTAIACATMTRNHLIFAGLWPAAILLDRHRNDVEGEALELGRRRRLFAYAAAGLAPVVLTVGLLAAYNWARFGNPLDTGFAYHEMDVSLRADYERYGAFNVHFVPTNLLYQFVAYPLPLQPESLMGGSVFLLTPVFFAALWGFRRPRPRRSARVLAGSIVLTAIPILLLMGTGWTQFGPRYTLDFTVQLLLLTAMGLPRWPMWLLTLATVISVFHYLVGALYLGTMIR